MRDEEGAAGKSSARLPPAPLAEAAASLASSPVPSPQSPAPSPQSPVPSPQPPVLPVRLLVVTYYFPPSGGGGVQRPLKWAKYLPAAGVEPVVLTVREGAYPHLDRAMAADVPPGVRVERTAAPDPFGAYGRLTGRSRGEAVAARTGRVGASGRPAERAARWVRANVFVPDARVGWVPFAVARARRLARERAVDAVLTTGPPHSAHLVGLALRRGGLPWVADFRDPWTEIHYLGALARGAAARRLDAALERAVLGAADAVVTVSDPLREAIRAKGPRGPVVTVRNGFDPADFGGPPVPVRPDRFEVAHVGTLHGIPHALLDAAARLRERGGFGQGSLRFVGSVPDGLAAAAEARGLADALVVGPAVPHAEAVRAMRRAALLLLAVEPWSYADGVLPGKTFEYLASGRPALALAPPEGEAARVLAEAGGGRTFAHGDADGVAAELARHHAAWAAGAPLAGAPSHALGPYARPVQAARVAALVREVVG